MKRSKIQQEIANAKALIEKNNIKLPMFGYWNLDEWKSNIEKLGTIRQTLLGWDVTDFGHGDFDKIGAVLFTIRNGVLNKPEVGCPYAEKLIIMKDSQVLPLHFHFNKTEDIINRAGGVLQIQVYNSLENEEVDYESDVNVYLDGILHTVPAGTIMDIYPGNSMTITPRLYHLFMAKPGEGDVVVGEVSAVNDDSTDNRFAAAASNYYAGIEEDEAVTVPLNSEYEAMIFNA